MFNYLMKIERRLDLAAHPYELTVVVGIGDLWRAMHSLHDTEQNATKVFEILETHLSAIKRTFCRR